MTALLLLISSAQAQVWSTGQIDLHVFPGDAPFFTTSPLTAGSQTTLELQYGLWNSPDVDLEVYFQGTYVGTVTADSGFSSPGPAYEVWDVTPLVVNGPNVIDILTISGGEAVIGYLEVDQIVTDSDGDGVLDASDNCPTVPNPQQQDIDGDGIGDACDPCDDLVDPDTDDDGVCDSTDACPGFDDDLDGDNDGVADACDICPSDPDPSQADSDGDGAGDACDVCPNGDDFGPDGDRDSLPDGCDNCPTDFNPTQADLDGDGWGDACECGPGVPEVFPGADELCNNRDDDCDGELDEDPVDAATWYLDADGDGQGSPDNTTSDCSQPDGYVDNADDCDDGAAEALVGGEEVCDGLDNDCDGVVDPQELGCEPDEVPEAPAAPAATGCGCASSGGEGALGLLGLSLIIAFRRR